MSDKIYICENLSATGTLDSISGNEAFIINDADVVAAANAFLTALKDGSVAEAHVLLNGEAGEFDISVNTSKLDDVEYGKVYFLPTPVIRNDNEYYDSIAISEWNVKLIPAHAMSVDQEYMVAVNNKTYSITIYYEESSGPKPFTPERAGLPDMNVTLNYENPTNNGIALVTKALLMNISHFPDVDEEMLTDVTYNPGYAPFERLAKAVALCFDNPDPYTANSESYVVDFANDWERLAFAICPSMFLKQVVEPEDDGPIHTIDPDDGK